MYVCLCHAVTEGEILDAVVCGAHTEQAVADAERVLADRQEAHDAAVAKLEALRKEKAAMEKAIAEAKAAADLAKRKQGASVSAECQNNPLAKGCM